MRFGRRNGSELAERTGVTRTAASVLELDRQGVYDDAIAVVWSAPTAALALTDCIEDGTRPAAVVATPVGFIKVAESRKRVREIAHEHGVPNDREHRPPWRQRARRRPNERTRPRRERHKRR